jgi:DNA-binding NarL/FixJ family response regulator
MRPPLPYLNLAQTGPQDVRHAGESPTIGRLHDLAQVDCVRRSAEFAPGQATYGECAISSFPLEGIRQFHYKEGVPEAAELHHNPTGSILIVDDDERLRAFLSELLESVGYRTVQVATGTAVLRAAETERPAVVILDVQLPGLNGYEVCRQLRERFGDSLSILFISGERTEPLDRAGGLLLGADDYMTKPIDSTELIARVRRVVERPRTNDEAGGSDERLASLTNREHEVLGLLTHGYRQGEIANELVISPKTVATHIQHILGKLEVHSRAQAVAVALREEAAVRAHVEPDQLWAS